VSATDGDALPRALSDAVDNLYRACRRKPPELVLVARDPPSFVQLILSAGRGFSLSSVLLLLLGSLIPGAVAVTFWARGSSDLPLAELSAITGLLLTLLAFGPDIASEATRSRVHADMAAVSLLVIGAALATVAVTGSLQHGCAAFAVLAAAAGTLKAAALVNGGIPGRLGLAYRCHVSVMALASEPIDAALRGNVELGFDGSLSRHRPPLTVNRAQDLAAWRQLEEMIRRRIGSAWHDLLPSLGRIVPTEDFMQPAKGLHSDVSRPVHDAALRVGSRCEAAVLFERAAVVLLPAIPMAATVSTSSRWRPRREPYAGVLALLVASPFWYVLLAVLPSDRLADRVLARVIAADPDPVLRLEAMERMGFTRFFVMLGAVPLNRGAAGELFAAGPVETVTMVVRVVDAVQEPDGTPRVHWLPVPPHVVTAREAVAWTFGKTAGEWDPLLET
jgi:hypothetical protein